MAPLGKVRCMVGFAHHTAHIPRTRGDEPAFELERRFHTPFFDNIVREGVAL